MSKRSDLLMGVYLLSMGLFCLWDALVSIEKRNIDHVYFSLILIGWGMICLFGSQQNDRRPFLEASKRERKRRGRAAVWLVLVCLAMFASYTLLGGQIWMLQMFLLLLIIYSVILLMRYATLMEVGEHIEKRIGELDGNQR